jgi:acetyltransferase-like isoleucine patch superfamily enzyme
MGLQETESVSEPRPSLRRFVAVSNHPMARLGRRVYKALFRLSLPLPRSVARPMLWAYLGVRSAYHFVRRVFFAEPLFRAYCTKVGKRFRGDIYVPWVQGQGVLILGDDVTMDGLIGISFAARFTARPTLEIGDGTGIGHGCGFVVGKRITIGRFCRIAGGCQFFDSSGHPSDPAERLADAAPDPSAVRPITVGDNVWVGVRCLVFPGVTIGEGSVVSAGSVVTSDVPPFTVVAGNPARRIAALKAPAVPDNNRAAERQPVPEGA